MKRLLRHTIWATGAIPFDEYKYRHLRRVYLPLYDVLFVWAGLIAVRYGIPSLDSLLPNEVADALGWTLVGVSVVALVGVSVPRLWVLEFAAKSVLLIILVVYFLALRVMGAESGTDGYQFISVIVLAATVLLLFRFSLLTEEAQNRKLTRGK